MSAGNRRNFAFEPLVLFSFYSMARSQLIPATPLRAGARGGDPDPVVSLESLSCASRDIEKLEYVGKLKKQKLNHWCGLIEGVVEEHPVEGYRDIFTTLEPVVPQYNTVTWR